MDKSPHYSTIPTLWFILENCCILRL